MKQTNKRRAPRRSREWGRNRKRLIVIRTRQNDDAEAIEAVAKR